jgi:hypothetical protein
MSAGGQLRLFPLPPASYIDGVDLAALQARWPCRACDGMPLPTPWSTDLDERLRPYYGYDPCLGCLPGVLNACCGHGGEHQPYVLLDGGGPSKLYVDNPSLHGNEALAYFRSLGVGPPDEAEAEPAA